MAHDPLCSRAGGNCCCSQAAECRNAATRGYYLRDVAAKKAEILAVVPGAQVETWQDYGFRLTVVSGDVAMTVMQPARDENGQEYINRPASDAIRFLCGDAV